MFYFVISKDNGEENYRRESSQGGVQHWTFNLLSAIYKRKKLRYKRLPPLPGYTHAASLLDAIRRL